MQIIGVRHGQSQYNLLGLCNDDPAAAVDLTPLGAEQAATAARHLQALRIDAVYCSPLLRTSRTARIIGEAIGVDVVDEPRLSDIRSGCESQPVAQYLSAIAHDPVHAKVGDGESLAEYRQRVEGFLCELSQVAFGCVLLVVHEETLRIFQSVCAGESLAAVAGRSFDNCRPYFFDLPSGN